MDRRGPRLVALIALLLGSLAGLQACSWVPRIVILHDPLTPEEHVSLGTSYEAQGLTELAAREYRAALDSRKDCAPALVGLGNLSFEAGAFEEAERAYRRALEVSPGHPVASNNLAMLLLASEGPPDEAERLARSALAAHGPLRPYALDTLARLYVKQRRYDEARRALQEAQAAAPPDDRTLRERLAALERDLPRRSSSMSEP